MVPAGSPSAWYGRDDQGALGERRHPGLGADRHLQTPVEHVAQQRDHDVLLLEHPEHLAHRLDGVEGARHLRGAADEDVVGDVAVLLAERGERLARRAHRWRHRRVRGSAGERVARARR